MSSKLFILILILHLITAYPHRIEVFVDPNLPHESTGEQDVVVIDLSDNNIDEFNLSNLASEAKTSLKESSPVLYALKSINDLQTKHFDKLNSRNNTFYFKETNSALYFDNDAKKWTEIKKNDPDNTPKTEFLDWLPISFCLDSRLGSGGLIYRQVKVMLEATSQLNAALVLHTNPVGFLTGLGGILGFKVGMQKAVLITFNCYLNQGELCQLQYRPSYVEVPSLTKTLFKLRKNKLKIHSKQTIKPFRMFLAGIPEHRCWVTKDPNDLQCKKRIVNNQTIRL